jgi:hypothetical protein
MKRDEWQVVEREELRHRRHDGETKIERRKVRERGGKAGRQTHAYTISCKGEGGESRSACEEVVKRSVGRWLKKLELQCVQLRKWAQKRQQLLIGMFEMK